LPAVNQTTGKTGDGFLASKCTVPVKVKHPDTPWYGVVRPGTGWYALVRGGTQLVVNIFK
jgi:hypothetical protein